MGSMDFSREQKLVKNRSNTTDYRFNFFRLEIIILIFISFSTVKRSQNYKVEYITPQDGLSHGCVHDIIQDSKGFMWFATEGGLNRYDGYDIKLFNCGQKFI